MLLASLLTGSACISCSKTPEETKSAETVPESAPDTVAEAVDETETEDPYIYDDLPDEQFNGYNYRVLSGTFFSRETAFSVYYDELTGIPVDDQLYYTKETVQERFDVVLSHISVGSYNDVAVVTKNTVSANDNSFDILIGQDTTTVQLGAEGYCLDLRSIDEFNFEKPWWPEFTVTSLSIGDRMFAASSYLTHLGLQCTRAILINKDYAKDLQIEVPYEDVRQGKWTLDRMIELTKDASLDLNGDGKLDPADDRFALASGKHTTYCWQDACNIPVYERDENNLPVLRMDIEQADTFIEKLSVLLGADRYIHEGGYGKDIFAAGKALFTYTLLKYAYDTFRDTDMTYGFLPTPKMNEQQESYNNPCTDAPWALPGTLNTEQQHIVGTVTEALSCQNYNNVLPAYFEGALKARIADAPDDAAMLQLIADTRSIGFAYAFSMIFKDIVNDCVLNENNVASYFESSKTKAETALENLKEAFAEVDS